MILYGDEFVGVDGTGTFNATTGADTLNNSSNNDIAVFNVESGELNISRNALTDTISGGSKMDTVRILDGQNINLSGVTNLSTNLTNIEHIDLVDGSASNTLTLGAQDVLDITDGDNTLYIDGDASDNLVLSSADGTWTQGAKTTVNGVTYASYTSGTATVNVQDDVIVTVS